MKRPSYLFFTLLFPLIMAAQSIDNKFYEGLKFRNIGPAGMSGRITSIDVNLRDKTHIYVGAASGGVWESKNGGITWQPIFDEQSTLSIGSIEINQANPAEIWVGTGEGNPRNSHNSGAGVFKSLDGGQTWGYMGLKETKLIHRVIVNESDTKSVLVGAMGSAWGPSKHRGVYRTKDGGKTWKQTLYVGNQVGIADLVADPSNPNKILAAMWEFGRTPWGFNSGGKGSGLYMTLDGGDTWKKLSSDDGLPEGNLGRMGLAFAPSKPNIVYALIEAKKNGLYKSIDGGKKWHLVSTKEIGNRPFYYAEIYVDPKNENRIYNLWSYVSKSEDGGKTFKTIMDYGNNIHPDHHAFWIDPDDSNYLIDGNDGGLNISRDGSKTWRFVENLPVGQFYHVSVDDDFPYHVYGGMQDNGSWVGPGYVLRRGGIKNFDWQEILFGDGFDVKARRDDNRYGYGMSQEGHLSMWDKVTGKNHYIQPQHPEGKALRYNWNAALALDPNNDHGLYYGSQHVHYSKDMGHSWEIRSPDLTTNDTIKQDQSKSGGLTLDVTGAENHTTILCITPSPHDDQVIWVGTDDGLLQVTRDGGQNWKEISAKLPGCPKGAWIPQIVQSPTNSDELFVVVNNYRMNDWSAYLYHTSDGGTSWKRIVNDSQVKGFVCSVVQDPKHDDLLFLGTDVGLYFSLDHGKQWHKWGKGLPPVQIRDMQIQATEDDLVLGTFGRSFWVLDELEPLRDLSRKGLKLLSEDLKLFQPNTAYLTAKRSYQGVRFIGQGEFIGDNRSTNVRIPIWTKPDSQKKEKAKVDSDDDNKKPKSKEGKDKKAKFIVIDNAGDTVRQFERKLEPGMSLVGWDPDRKGVAYPQRKAPKEKQEPGGMPILPGIYKIICEYKKQKDSTSVEVALDPRMDKNKINTIAKSKAVQAFNSKVEKVTQAYNNLKEAKKSLGLYDQIIGLQKDSLNKELKAAHKAIHGNIDSLMNLYMLPERDKPEYVDDAHTLNSQLWKARQFLGTSSSAPTDNGRHAIRKAEVRADEILHEINTFFESNWPKHVENLRNLKLDIFKDYEAIKIE